MSVLCAGDEAVCLAQVAEPSGARVCSVVLCQTVSVTCNMRSWWTTSNHVVHVYVIAPPVNEAQCPVLPGQPVLEVRQEYVLGTSGETSPIRWLMCLVP